MTPRYFMRNGDKKIVTVPVPLLKEDFRKQAKALWMKYRRPIDELTDEQWGTVA